MSSIFPQQFRYWWGKLDTQGPVKFGALVFLVSVLRSGLWVKPDIAMQLMIVASPTKNPFVDPNAHYLFWTWLSPAVAALLGLNTPQKYIVYSAVLSISGCLVLSRFLYRRYDDTRFKYALVLLFLLPVSMTSFYWLGTDSMTFLLFAFLVTIRKKSPLLIIAVLIGMQNFEQGLVAIFAVFGWYLFCSRKELFYNSSEFKWVITWIKTTLPGLFLGKITLIVLFSLFDTNVNSGRTHWLEENLIVTLKSYIFHPHIVIVGLFGPSIVFILHYCRKSLDRSFFFLVIVLVTFVALVGDQTRVFAFISFPIIFFATVGNSNYMGQITKDISLKFLLMLNLVPWIWVWGGAPRTSAIAFDIAYVLNSVIGWPHLPTDIYYWPF